MRLLSKTSLLIITVSIFIFMTGNIVFFYVLKNMINDHVKNELNTQMYEIINAVNHEGVDINSEFYKDDVSIRVLEKEKKLSPVIFDTVLYDNLQRKYIPHKALKFTYKFEGQTYLISIFKSMLSSNKLIERITVASIFLVLSFLFVIYTLNRFIFVNVWSNFFSNLRKIHRYNINSREKLMLEKSEIDEFELLNSVIKQMVKKIQTDFTTLKELTENTSHEIQTPLAVIKSKAEILLQSENISKKDIELVYSILNTSDRLSKLNQTLLMISKIENNQFEKTKEINVKETIDKYINNFEMLINAGNFKLIKKISDLYIEINPVLSDVLISNLIKNAIVHNYRGGLIKISTENSLLRISNSGKGSALKSENLFKRFVKGSNDIRRTGLGLEIVKKICDFNHFTVKYDFSNDLHNFIVDFSPVKE
ncbi:MAG: HAMP domain-containing histidine kinase [Chlorobi bacterium]|nr:HAMP domain-containing histidine kinase [Chlorobiota bacterium]